MYSTLPLQRTSLGQTPDARLSGLTLHPTAASKPLPARMHQVTSGMPERSAPAASADARRGEGVTDKDPTAGQSC